MGPVTTSTGLFHGFAILHLMGSQGGYGSLAPSVWGGLIGGGTVLCGVLLAEYLARRREQTQRFKDEVWNVVAQGTDIFVEEKGLTREEIQRRSSFFVAQLGRLRGAANPPQLKSRQKCLAVEGILIRYAEVRVAWRDQGVAPKPDYVIGDEINRLVYYRPWWKGKQRRVKP